MSIFNKYGPKGRQPEYLETDENEEIAMLHKRIQDEAPAPGSQLSRLLLCCILLHSFCFTLLCLWVFLIPVNCPDHISLSLSLSADFGIVDTISCRSISNVILLKNKRKSIDFIDHLSAVIVLACSMTCSQPYYMPNEWSKVEELCVCTSASTLYSKSSSHQ